MTNDYALCPFSKPILGKWCQCSHAKLAERCSGKMKCSRTIDLQPSCNELDNAIKNNTRFILGVKSINSELTHAQLMKIRCGGILGMKKVLNIPGEPVDIRHVVEKSINSYGELGLFPFDKIVLDIKIFKHRK